MTPSASGVQIRPATVADVPAMAGTRDTDLEVGPADPRMAAYLDGRHHPRGALEARVAYVAIVDGVVAGYIAGHLTRRFGCQGEVQYLYVSAAYRRRRVATALVEQLARWFVAQRAARVCVDVNAESPAAGRFYASCGAEPLRPHWLAWPNIGSVCADADQRHG